MLLIISTGGCENIILSGSVKDFSIKYQNVGKMKSVTCHEDKLKRRIPEPTTNLKSHIYGQKLISKLTPYAYQPYATYKTSELNFVINVSFDTPLRFRPNSPALSFLFMQTEPYSWVDIAVYIKPVPHTNKPLLKQAYLAGLIHLSNGSNINSKLIGSIIDQMCIINFDAKKSKKKSAQFKLSMKTRIKNRHKDLFSFLRFPLWLTFNATVKLSKLSPDFILKLQGHPIELAISNLVEPSYVLNIFWVSDKVHASFRSQMLKDCARREWWCHICIPSKLNQTTESNRALGTYHLLLYESSKCNNGTCPFNKDDDSVFKDNIPYKYQGNLFSKSKCVRCLASSCLRLPSEKNQIIYFIFDYDFILPYYGCNIPYETKKSWIEASMLCRSAGGHLPIIRSRKQLNDLMDIIKMIEQLPPIHLIFIGLINLQVTY